MTNKKSFVKICERCEKTFETDSKDVRICLKCKSDAYKKYQKEYREKNRKKTKEYREQYKKPRGSGSKRIVVDIPLRELTAIIERYNRKHKTHYTYGQFVSLTNAGRIKIEM